MSVRRIRSVRDRGERSAQSSAEYAGGKGRHRAAGGGTSVLELAGIVADFAHLLGVLQQKYADEMQTLVETFIERTIPFKDRCQENNAVIDSWGALLSSYGATAQEIYELGSVLDTSIASQLWEVTNHRLDLLTEVMGYHQTFSMQLQLFETQLEKTKKDYTDKYAKMQEESSAADLKSALTIECYKSLNSYVLQLAATNQGNTNLCHAALLKTVGDLEAIQCDLQEAISFSLNRYARLLQTQLLEQSHRIDPIISSTKKSSIPEVLQDLTILAAVKKPELKLFEFQKVDEEISEDFGMNQLIFNTATEGSLKEQHNNILKDIRELESSLSSSKEMLGRLRKSLDSQKTTQPSAVVAQTLSEIHKMKYDIRKQDVALASRKAQLLLFSPDWFSASNLANGHAVMGTDSTSNSNQGSPALNGSPTTSTGSAHIMQEYNFIKPTVCDQCKMSLKGLMRQGLRCKLCKLCIHTKCNNNLPSCNSLLSEPAKLTRKPSKSKLFRRQASVQDIRVSLPDKRKFLRRQKSSSAIEIPDELKRESQHHADIDPVYQAIKCAASLSTLNGSDTSRKSPSPKPSSKLDHSPHTIRGSRTSLSSHREGMDDGMFFLSPDAAGKKSVSKSAPHSPSFRSRLRHWSLDRYGSPRFPKKTLRRNNSVNDAVFANTTNHPFQNSPTNSSDSRRKILQTYGKSISLDNEAATKDEEVERRNTSTLSLDTNKARLGKEYVALYDFDGMLKDDLSLKAGEKVRVLSGKNSDWWKGELKGKVGCFPSFCVVPISSQEKVLRVSNGCKAAQERADGITLRQNQIVIQSGNEDNGWIKVRTSIKSGYYPATYLEPVESHGT